MLTKVRLHWTGHYVRKADECLPKQILFSEFQQGKRSVGGLRKHYKAVLKDS